MDIDSEKINSYYERYELAENRWSNINLENINVNSGLMYNLYKSLMTSAAEQNEPVISSSNYEKKKIETINRFIDLGNFMSDTNSIKILAEKNNKAYSFLPIENNPFKLTEKQCEKVYKVNSEETLFETKARTIDCENKITKMCMAQILKIVEPDAKSKAINEDDIKREIITRTLEYTMLYNRLQKSKLGEHEELLDKSDMYTEYGFFDMTKFLDTANESNSNGKPLEFKEKYGKIIDTVINEEENENVDENNTKDNPLKGMEYDISNFGKFAIAKSLMIELYKYKESDLEDLFNEYDLIKGTKEESNVLITSNKDVKIMNKNIDRVVHVTIQGYNQPFSVHVRENAYKQYEEKYGEIPCDVLRPVVRKSMVTYKLEDDTKSIVSSVYKQHSGQNTIAFLANFEERQDIDGCRDRIRYEESEKKKQKELVEQQEQKERAKSISGINKKIRKYKSKSKKLEIQIKEIRGKLKTTPMAKHGGFDGRKKIQKQSKNSNKSFVMQKLKQATELENELDKLYCEIKELQKQFRELQNNNNIEKEDRIK